VQLHKDIDRGEPDHLATLGAGMVAEVAFYRDDAIPRGAETGRSGFA